jgi:hypothetical protein
MEYSSSTNIRTEQGQLRSKREIALCYTGDHQSLEVSVQFNLFSACRCFFAAWRCFFSASLARSGISVLPPLILDVVGAHSTSFSCTRRLDQSLAAIVKTIWVTSEHRSFKVSKESSNECVCICLAEGSARASSLERLKTSAIEIDVVLKVIGEIWHLYTSFELEADEVWMI